MDLFIDKSYKLHSENKLNYSQIVLGSDGSFPSDTHTITGPGSGRRVYVSGNAVVISQPSGIEAVRIIRNSTGAHMDEVRISSTAKKFVLE
jgi:hypothetical protein